MYIFHGAKLKVALSLPVQLVVCDILLLLYLQSSFKIKSVCHVGVYYHRDRYFW